MTSRLCEAHPCANTRLATVGMQRRTFLSGCASLLLAAGASGTASASSGAELIASAQAVLRRLLRTSTTAARLGDYVHGILIFPSILEIGAEVKTGTGVLIVDGACGGYFTLSLRSSAETPAGLAGLVFYLMDMETNVAFAHAPTSLTDSSSVRFIAADADARADQTGAGGDVLAFPMGENGLLPRFDRPVMAMKRTVTLDAHQA